MSVIHNGRPIEDLTREEFVAFQALVNQEGEKRVAAVTKLYGERFATAVGADLLYSLPEVSPESLGLGNVDGKKHPSTVLPSHLQANPAVRGVMGTQNHRPFVAVQVELLDQATGALVSRVVELVFKHYSIEGDGAPGSLHENNYVTGLECPAEGGQRTFSSSLYGSGGMTENQMKALGQLLRGKTIKAPVGHYWIRMAAGN